MFEFGGGGEEGRGRIMSAEEVVEGEGEVDVGLLEG